MADDKQKRSFPMDKQRGEVMIPTHQMSLTLFALRQEESDKA